MGVRLDLLLYAARALATILPLYGALETYTLVRRVVKDEDKSQVFPLCRTHCAGVQSTSPVARREHACRRRLDD